MPTAGKETVQVLLKPEQLYEYIISECQKQVPIVERGKFGADMKVQLINDGPFTIILDSEKL